MSSANVVRMCKSTYIVTLSKLHLIGRYPDAPKNPEWDPQFLGKIFLDTDGIPLQDLVPFNLMHIKYGALPVLWAVRDILQPLSCNLGQIVNDDMPLKTICN